jgi:hypothetical protein
VTSYEWMRQHCKGIHAVLADALCISSMYTQGKGLLMIYRHIPEGTIIRT